MKKVFPILLLLLFITSCQTRIVTPNRPMKLNSLELYQTYSIQTNDQRVMKVKVLRQDNEKIYGKLKSGEEVILDKSNVREVKKPDVFSSIFIALVAVAAVVFVPM